MFKKLFKLIIKRKITFGIIAIILVAVGYWGFKSLNSSAPQVRYVLATVEKGTLITSVSGSGQIAASNQIDLQPRASGDVTGVAVKLGQEVKTGSTIIWLNAKEAQKAVRDAAANLESAQLSLDKLNKPADELSILQAENSLAQAQESKQNAQDDLQKTYDDGFNTVANAYLDLPGIMSGVYDLLFGTTLSSNQTNADYYTDAVKIYDERILQYKDEVNTAYQVAKSSYDKSFEDYKAASRYSGTDVIESLINETYETTKDVAELVKSANNLVQFYKDKTIERGFTPVSLASTHLTSLSTYTSETNSHLVDLLSIKNTIQTDKETIVSAQRSIAEKTQSLADLQAGTDPLDIQAQELTIKQRQNALADAQEKLADYVVKAPFDGIIAALNVEWGDTVSSGTAVATLVTKQKIAEVQLNEVDVAKVKIGQKATLTFDAVEGLNITGEVAEIDTLGTVTQGVVTYNVKIVFDTQDERIKSGMSVSASIITEVKTDVLLVSNSAVQSSGDSYYVEVPNETVNLNQGGSSAGVTLNNPPRQQTVEIGLANDSMTEIVSGLKEGDGVVIRTIDTTSLSNTTSGNPGGNRGGGGGAFFIGH